MSGPNIILEPKLMFKSLQELEKETKDLVTSVHFIGQALFQVSTITYAIGFGELMKQAEKNINQFGSVVVAATNAVNVACSEVVYELVQKFAPQGAKERYEVTPYEAIDITTLVPDRVAIYPPLMKQHLEDLFNKIFNFGTLFSKMEKTFGDTRNFWVGQSADRVRSNFMTKVDPKFSELVKVLYEIHSHCVEWVDETIKYEASLSTP